MATKDLPSISLSDIEAKSLTTQDPWFEIKDRFTDLSISLPSGIDKNNPKDSDYFLAKSYLSVHSALSRTFKEHSEKTISEYTGELKDVFQKADERGKALFEKEDSYVTSLLSDMKPILGSLESDLSALSKMNEESKLLVGVATSIQDRQSIQEKTEQRVQEIAPEKKELS